MEKRIILSGLQFVERKFSRREGDDEEEEFNANTDKVNQITIHFQAHSSAGSDFHFRSVYEIILLRVSQKVSSGCARQPQIFARTNYF